MELGRDNIIADVSFVSSLEAMHNRLHQIVHQPFFTLGQEGAGTHLMPVLTWDKDAKKALKTNVLQIYCLCDDIVRAGGLEPFETGLRSFRDTLAPEAQSGFSTVLAEFLDREKHWVPSSWDQGRLAARKYAAVLTLMLGDARFPKKGGWEAYAKTKK
jgi:hypothetical protein